MSYDEMKNSWQTQCSFMGEEIQSESNQLIKTILILYVSYVYRSLLCSFSFILSALSLKTWYISVPDVLCPLVSDYQFWQS